MGCKRQNDEKSRKVIYVIDAIQSSTIPTQSWIIGQEYSSYISKDDTWLRSQTFRTGINSHRIYCRSAALKNMRGLVFAH